MKKYIQAIYQSFGNAALYAQVIYRWTGSGFAYLLTLAALLAFCMTIQISILLYQFNKHELPHLLAQIPEITIAHGEIENSTDQTHVITNTDNQAVITIDITKDEDALAKDNGLILIGKSFFLIRQSNNQTERFEMKKLFREDTVTLDQETVQNFFMQLRYMIFASLPFFTLAQWLRLIAFGVLTAALSYVVTAYMAEEYNFETRMRIAAIAITPPLIVNQILNMLTPYDLSFGILLAIWVLHVYLIVIATRHYVRRHAADLLN